jgi:ribosomal protein S6--L-glutamate ligase
MFRAFGLPHPKTRLFRSVRELPKSFLNSIDYPVVVKSSSGGEGENVFFVPDSKTMAGALNEILLLERSGFPGFLIQDYIPNDDRDLRVVIMGNRLYAYWRIAPKGEFLHNISRGASYETEADEQRKQAGLKLAATLRDLTGINLAGVDIIFHREDIEGKKPLLLEVNYFFGRTGLGGNEVYYRLLNEVVREWLLSEKED